MLKLYFTPYKNWDCRLESEMGLQYTDDWASPRHLKSVSRDEANEHLSLKCSTGDSNVNL